MASRNHAGASSALPVVAPLPSAAAVALVGALAVFAASAQGAEVGMQLPSGVTAGPSVEGIHEFRLENGLRVLLFPDPTKETITVNITYLVGSRHENYGETGMAHLLEHLLFKGSTNHPNVPDELTKHGARPNGTTWLDRTNYFETFASSDENLDWALDLEADRMVNSFIAKKDLDSEMSVVRNEFEMGENEPNAVLEERVLSTSYLWHNYGNSTIGARADIENVPIDRLQAFYRMYYQPDNAVLAVAGDIELEKTLQLVNKKFGPIPKPSRTIPTLYTTEPAQDGERAVTLRRVGDSQALCVAFHVPAGSHPDYVALDLAAFILGDAPSGRLYKALVEPQHATWVASYQYSMKDPTVFMAKSGIPSDKSIETARNTMLETLDGLAKNPPTKEEVERARARMLKDWEMTMLNSERAALELSEWSAMGDWRLMFMHRDRLKAVSADDVARVAKTYLVENNRTVGTFVPTEKPERIEIPATPDVASLVASYKGGEAIAAGEDFQATPENIEAKVIRKTLPNGLELVMLPKKTRGATVNASLALHFGSAQSLQGHAQDAEMAGMMLMRGTSEHSRQEIQDEIDRLKARIGVWGGAEGANANIQTTAEHLEGSLRLVSEMLRTPAFPPAEFGLVKEAQLQQIEESKSDPQSLASIALERHVRPWQKGHPRYVSTIEEEKADLEASKVEKAVQFHRDFYGASNGELAVVGDFDPAAVEALVTTLLGHWKSPQPYERIVSPYRDVAPMDLSLEAPDKESAVFQAALPVELKDSDPKFPSLALSNFITGGGFLNSRLAVRIRQKEGISYGVGSWLAANAHDEGGWFRANAIYAPQNAERLMAAFKEEIARIREEGFTAEEVAEAKSGWLQSRAVSRGQDRELAGALASRAEENRTMAWDAELEKNVGALTPDQLVEAFREYIALEKMTFVRAGDFEKVRRQAGASAAP